MLFDKRSIIASPIESVFDLVVDLANAPHVHPVITKTVRVDEGNTVGIGTIFRKSYQTFGTIGDFDLEITEFSRNKKVVFTGTAFYSIIPKFTIHFREVDGGTEIHYVMNPIILKWMSLLTKPLAQLWKE